MARVTYSGLWLGLISLLKGTVIFISIKNINNTFN